MKDLTIFLLIIILQFTLSSATPKNGNREIVADQSESKITKTSCQEPDYNDLNNWAASPFKEDTGDSIPFFLKDEIRDTRADAFFIHPTTYFSELQTADWNASLNDQKLNHATDSKSILFQATVFNGSCRVFAPRYRQANLKAFFVFGTPIANHAFDLAYSDVRKAFLYFLENYNGNRPIIIASHSQGSLHAIRLLKEFFDGKPLQKRLVCAYIIGCQIEKNTFRNIKVGECADQTACFVGWRSYAKGEIPKSITAENGNSVCVNPLTWTTSGQWASRDLHAGMLNRIKIITVKPLLSASSEQQVSWAFHVDFMNEFKSINSHCAEAGIEPVTKILWVDIPGTIERDKCLHLYDYNLFWMNIRQNVKQRIDAYFKNIGQL